MTALCQGRNFHTKNVSFILFLITGSPNLTVHDICDVCDVGFLVGSGDWSLFMDWSLCFANEKKTSNDGHVIIVIIDEVDLCRYT